MEFDNYISNLNNWWTYQKFCSILLFLWIFNWSIYWYSFIAICGVW